jgi:hypothetical protein
LQLPGEVTDRSVIIYMTGALCTQPAQIFQSWQARAVIQNFLDQLQRRESSDLKLLAGLEVKGSAYSPSPAAQVLARLLGLLVDLPCEQVRVKAPDLASLVREPLPLAELVERLYDHWRGYERYLIFEGAADHSRDRALEGHMPFIYNNQDLTSLVREAYRRIERNLRGYWPRVYRQVPAGANLSLLIDRIRWSCPGGPYEVLRDLRMIRLALLTPPVLLYPRRNRRKGKITRSLRHPLRNLHLDLDRWLCIPLRVGELCFLFFFDRDYLSLAISLVNLFELSGHEEARRKPDGIVLFGLPPESMEGERTSFYIDEEEDIVIGSVVKSEEVDYFGYCKKMILTLHNVIMMRRGRLPIHGAMCRLRLRHGPDLGLLIAGDSGAGKSETLEAFRIMADEWISDLTVVFDDMGSLLLTPEPRIRAYGTEIGAFVRLDDLDPGYAFGHFDRSIFMNPHRQNARVVLPITEYSHIVAGYPVDLLLYANNYEPVTEDTPAVEFFSSPSQALSVFQAGYRVSKGTTDERGLVRTYFANPFGPEQLPDLHQPLAERYFEAAAEARVQLGQIRTRLGIEGWEREGPRQAAEALFRHLLGQVSNRAS